MLLQFTSRLSIERNHEDKQFMKNITSYPLIILAAEQ